MSRDRLAFAFRVGTAHGVLAVLVQLERAAPIVARLRPATPAGLRLIVELPFLQLQNLAVAAGLALVAYLCAGRRWWRSLPHLLLLLGNSLLVVDQLAWNVFLSHLDVTPGDLPWRSLAALRSSVWAAAGWELAINLAALAALSLWAWRSASGPPPWTAARRRWAAAWLVVVAAVSILADSHHLAEHPLVAMVRSASSRWRQGPAVAATVPLAELYLPRFDRAPPPPGEDEKLLQALARLRRLDHPNVLLVVLESVGTKQLFLDGKIQPGLTPALAGALRDGVAFTSVYTPFPGTTRAHIALESGGATLTWGDFNGARGAAYPADNAARSFARLGYRTAVFSAGDMGPQYLDDLLLNQGYDLVFDPQRQAPAWRAAHGVSSWGVDEDAVRERLNAWLPGTGQGPWYAQLLTISTHHPYLAPRLPIARDLQTRYRVALGYTDAAFGRLVGDLARSGRLRNTVILVTGDHGEAFGSFHLMDFGHRGFIYEENVRSFLLVLAPDALAGLGGPVVSERVASLGDVLPTVLDALGHAPAGMNGESLWPGAYRPRIAYFFKDTQPRQWGLRDGRWKFIAAQTGDKQFELYDLQRDPDEQANMAAIHPDLAAFYDGLCARWYASAGADFAARSRHGSQREMR